MATASITNVLVNGTVPDAGDFNTNYQDLVTFLNGSVLHLDGSKAMSGNLAMGSNRITGLAAPSASTDAARKSEVDGKAATSHTHTGYAATSHTHVPMVTGGVVVDTSLPALTGSFATIATSGSIARPSGWSSTLVVAWANVQYAATPSGLQIVSRIQIDSSAGTQVQSGSATTDHPVANSHPVHAYTTPDSSIEIAVQAYAATATGGTGKYVSLAYMLVRAS